MMPEIESEIKLQTQTCINTEKKSDKQLMTILSFH